MRTNQQLSGDLLAFTKDIFTTKYHTSAHIYSHNDRVWQMIIRIRFVTCRMTSLFMLCYVLCVSKTLFNFVREKVWVNGEKLNPRVNLENKQCYYLLKKRCSFKKDVLRNFAIFTEKTCIGVSF